MRQKTFFDDHGLRLLDIKVPLGSRLRCTEVEPQYARKARYHRVLLHTLTKLQLRNALLLALWTQVAPQPHEASCTCSLAELGRCQEQGLTTPTASLQSMHEHGKQTDVKLR